MKKQNRKYLCISLSLLILFVMWTTAISFVDVQAIGPQKSAVGFATVNGLFHNLTGVNMVLYTITDWLSLVPVGIIAFFGFLGLVQWIKRKGFLRVDFSILVLGGFYIVVMAFYVFFEIFVVNRRPVLINGVLEASYPSSTTMLVICVMSTAILQFNSRIKNNALRWAMNVLIALFIIFMVVLRLVSGVHWLTDIVGGVLLSAGLVVMYYFIVGSGDKNR